MDTIFYPNFNLVPNFLFIFLIYLITCLRFYLYWININTIFNLNNFDNYLPTVQYLATYTWEPPVTAISKIPTTSFWCAKILRIFMNDKLIRSKFYQHIMILIILKKYTKTQCSKMEKGFSLFTLKSILFEFSLSHSFASFGEDPFEKHSKKRWFQTLRQTVSLP